MAKTARLLAAESLMRVSEGGYSNIVLDAELRKAQLPPRDAAFAAALFYGTLERRITLDLMIGKYSAQPPDKLSPEALESLRLGFYQLVYMDSVPDSAAVNESVELVKELGQPKASGFVNGVMRSFIRAGKPHDFSRMIGAARLSADFSAPLWLTQKWIKEYGVADAKKALAACLGAPPVFLRVNTERTDAATLAALLAEAGLVAEPVSGLPAALKVTGGAPQNSPQYAQGLFHIQDISSQLCMEAFAPEAGDRVLDVCAAPGGKTFTASEMMGGEGEILACDLHPKRANLVLEGAKRLGLENIKALPNNAALFNHELGLFDKVLCDVPCSGLGVLRRKPEIRFKKPEEHRDLPEVQYKIAKISAKYLKRGGTLVYSTCTLSRAENDEIAARLISEGGLRPAPLPKKLAQYSRDGFSVTLMPGILNNDGFYIARFTL